ncbi:hypothetical protein ACJMK2_039488 [Sinanodonta woodiana]|uniref:C-type lectin domain-containing protein n=1 Tax=Sinanodonta woodiana TaxID=1069815 RepID=A0ABD3WC69_SINWO
MKILTLLGFLVLLTTSPMTNCIPNAAPSKVPIPVAPSSGLGSKFIFPVLAIILSSILLNAKSNLYSTECGQFCYRFENELCRSWDDSRKDCLEEGGDLLEPSLCTYPFFHRIVKNGAGSCRNVWIGGFRTLPRPEYMTVRGTPIPDDFQYWSFSNPSRTRNQACLQMTFMRGYLMNDIDCPRLGGYICQKPE